MTAEVLDGLSPQEADRDSWGDSLFHSPLGLFPFQADHTARSYVSLTEHPSHASLVLWDTGVGKTVMSIATMALLVEDDLVDQIIVVAEAGKTNDWAKIDVPRFSRLSVGLYKGTPERRERILAEPPQVLVMSYETGRNDLCEFKRKSTAITGSKMLTDFCKGKRVLIVFDEFSRLRSRRTNLYLAWDYLINRTLRRDKGSQVMVQGLTATSVERHPEDHWNACRLIAPEMAGSVAWFEQTYIKATDFHGNPTDWHNLSEADTIPGIVPLNRLFGEITLRKSKNDADVRAHFPSKVENPPTMVSLTDAHRELYERIEELYADASVSEQDRRVGFGLCRMLADHPMALTASQGDAAGRVVDAVGTEYLAAMGSSKIDAMLDWVRSMGEQQMVIFTFYGQTVLPWIEHALRSHRYSVVVNHGQMTAAERFEAQEAFKRGDAQIFLSSDAGARGLNLGCGSALLHYEAPLLYATYVQRSDRIHRIDSDHPSITIDVLVAKGTVDLPIMHNLIKRNRYTEAINDDAIVEEDDPGDTYLSASDRLRMLIHADVEAPVGA